MTSLSFVLLLMLAPAAESVAIPEPTTTVAPTRATGPLRIHPHNPRYFTDGSGRAIYLTRLAYIGKPLDYLERWPSFD